MQKSVEVTELVSSLSLKSLVLCLNRNPMESKKEKNPLLSSNQKYLLFVEPYLFTYHQVSRQKYPRDEKHSLNPGPFHKHRTYVKLTAIMPAEMQTPIRK